MDKYSDEYKAFTEHAKEWNYEMDLNKDGFFVSSLTQRAFNAFYMGWQASSAALVVELPPEHEQVYCGYDGT